MLVNLTAMQSLLPWILVLVFLTWRIEAFSHDLKHSLVQAEDDNDFVFETPVIGGGLVVDDEDIQNDAAGSGSVEGNESKQTVTEEATEGSGLDTLFTPASVEAENLYEIAFTVTSETYEESLSYSGSKDFKNMEKEVVYDIKSLYQELKRIPRVGVKEFTQGFNRTVHVKISLDVFGNVADHKVYDIINSALIKGRIGRLSVSQEGFTFKKMFDDNCPSTLGNEVIEGFYRNVAESRATLMIGNAFPCFGWLKSVRFYRENPDISAYLGLWHNISESQFILKRKLKLNPAPIGPNNVKLPHDWLVEEGDYLGFHYPSMIGDSGVINYTRPREQSLPSLKFFPTVIMPIYDEEIALQQPFTVNMETLTIDTRAFPLMSRYSGEYEHEVQIIECSFDEFQCRDKTCIPLSQRCNRYKDCSDSTDELDCESFQVQTVPTYSSVVCTRDEYSCPSSGLCIPIIRNCNEINCTESVDMTLCDSLQSMCAPHEFRCGDGTCLQPEVRCNKIADCQDFSDELGCIDTGSLCSRSDFQCRDGSDCIDLRKRCDNQYDCNDGSDEMDCASRCSPSEFHCGDGSNCIDLRRRCDNKYDCGDGSDEVDCGTPTVGTQICSDGEFRCGDGRCIRTYYWCDGKIDCPDGIDEESCPTIPATTPIAESWCDESINFKCDDRRCIEKYEQCNGQRDCSDGSDEESCEVLIASETLRSRAGQSFGFRCFSRVSSNRGLRWSRAEPTSYMPLESYDDGLGSLTISNVQPEDYGTYVCTDESGFYSKSVRFIVETPQPPRPLPITAPPACDENYYFRCRDGRCIDKRLQCNKVEDCQDGFDEDSCGLIATPSELRLRAGASATFRCLSRLGKRLSWSRDQPSQYMPQNAYDDGQGMLSIPGVQVSDSGVYVCRDEFGYHDASVNLNVELIETPQPPRPPPFTAPPACDENYYFRCRDGRCIDKRLQCNKVEDCQDGFDEDSCGLIATPSELRLRAGASATFRCLSRLGKRLSWSRDQPSHYMPQNAYDDGQGMLSIPGVQVSDSGVYVCRDEFGYYDASVNLNVELIVGPTIQPQPRPGICQAGETMCSSGQCIASDYVCDGDFDCPDQSDERNCMFHDSMCEPNEFKCSGGKCILKLWQCDGDLDCGKNDQSDESGCDTSIQAHGCRANEFKCLTESQCIPLGYHCDGQRDCHDQSDEVGCTIPIVPIRPPSERMAHQGENITLDCQAVGVPPPLIIWRLNWGHVKSSGRASTKFWKLDERNSKGELIILNLSQEDEGAYTCEAINSMGTVFAVPDTIVHVLPPEIRTCNYPYFNDLATQPYECQTCWCSGHTDRCRSSNLYYMQERRALDILHSDGVPYLAPIPGVLPKEENLQTFSELFQPFVGNKLNSYGGHIMYNVKYKNSGGGQSGGNLALVITGENKQKLYYFYDELPRPGESTLVKIPIREEYWYLDDAKQRRANRPIFMEILQNIASTKIRYSFMDRQRDVNISDIIITSAIKSTYDDLGKGILVENCSCPINYTGMSCEYCSRNYKRDEFGRCISTCKCHGHSEDCDNENYCRNCRDNTHGLLCESCLPGFYGDARRGSPLDCRQCPCPVDDRGQRTCSLTGNGEIFCYNCPPNSYGFDCQSCHVNYTRISNACVRVDIAASCNLDGTAKQYATSCTCKQNVKGASCNQCANDTFHLSRENPLGCTKCFCFGAGLYCDGGNDMSWSAVTSNFYPGYADGFQVQHIAANEPVDAPIDTVIKPGSVTFFNPGLTYGHFVWLLPRKYLENKLLSYGGHLNYTYFYQDRERRIENIYPDVTLEGEEGLMLSYRHNISLTEGRDHSISIPIKENYWYKTGGQLATREEILAVLSNLVNIQIEARGRTNSISQVMLDVAVDGLGGRRAEELESCACREGHEGRSCESCKPGYVMRKISPIKRECFKCDCYDHGECDVNYRKCLDCRHNTVGDFCESCAFGFYGDPTTRARDACKPCECPVASNDGRQVTGCEIDMVTRQVVCQSCPYGQTGQRCEKCLPGYTGNPYDVDGKCEPDGQGPVIIKPVDPVIVAETGHDIVLRCDVRGGREPMEVRWMRGTSEPLQARAEKRVDNSLIIRNVQPEDSGIYVCIVRNNYGQEEISVTIYVEDVRKPVVEIVPSNIEPIEGEVYELQCRVKNAANFRTVWSRVDRPMDRAVIQIGNSLHFSPLSRSNTGLYKCMVTTDTGSSYQETFYLEIRGSPKPPVIGGGPTSINATVGRNVELFCKVSSVYPSSVRWLKNGREYLGPRASVDSENTLRIIQIIPEDAGTYACVASNEIGENRYDVNILVFGDLRPVIEGSTFIEVNFGDSITLPCIVNSDSPFRVTWHKSDRGTLRFNQESQNSLTIQKATLDDSGIYTCSAENQYGKTEHSISVKVRERNVVSGNLQDVYTKVGSSVALRCDIEHPERYSIFWLRNDNDRELGPRATVDEKNVLNIDKINPDDAGRYTCVVQSVDGEIRQPIRIIVEGDGRPRILDVGPSLVKVTVRSDAMLTCLAESSTPYEVTWSKDGREVRNTEQTNKEQLFLRNVKLTDAGIYVCTVKNQFGSAENRITVEVISDGPKVAVNANYETVGDELILTLDCRVDGAATTVKWTRVDRRPLPARTRYERDNSIIVIPNFVEEDYGEYRCTASDDYGRISYGDVRVYSRGSKEEHYILEPRVQRVRVGDKVIFDCKYDKENDILYTIAWSRKDHKPLDHRFEEDDSDSGRLTIYDVNLNDAGIYVCNIVADSGEYKDEAEVIVEAPVIGTPEIAPSAEIRTSYDITVKEGDPLQVNCIVNGNPKPSVYWSFNGLGYTQFITPQGNLYIPQAKESDQGEYTCHAKNNQGTSSSRIHVNVQHRNYTVTVKAPSTVRPNQDVTMNCKADSYVVVEAINWARVDGELPEGSVYSQDEYGAYLRIPQCRQEDAGRYMCTVFFTDGKKEMSYHTITMLGDGGGTFTDPPSVTTPRWLGVYPSHFSVLIPEPEVTVSVGSRASFECFVMNDDTREARVRWSAYGRRPLPPNHQIIGNMLVINDVIPENSGSYICEIDTSGGKRQATVSLTVTDGRSEIPLILEPSGNYEIEEGQSLQLVCSHGFNKLQSVSWITPAGQYINGLGTVMFTTPYVDLNDAGEYTCISEDGYDQRVFVNVKGGVEKKSINIYPSTIRIAAGQSTEFKCEAPGYADIRWFKHLGGADPRGSTGWLTVWDSNAHINGNTLSFTDIAQVNAGLYKCIAGSLSELEAIASLEVLTPPVIRIQPNTIHLRPGEYLRLECTAEGSQPINFHWSRESHMTLPPYVMERNGVLEIMGIQESDAGKYLCSARNEIGTAESVADVVVLSPPTVFVMPKSLTEPVGSSAEFKCLSSGSPPPQVKWSKEAGNLPEYHSITDENSLILYNVQLADRGNYICTVSNEIGITRDIAYLEVAGTGITGGTDIQTRYVTATLGDRLEINCEVIGAPPPMAQWIKVGANLSPRVEIVNSTLLVIPAMEEEDAGTYKCIASSAAGTYYAHVVVDINVPPFIPMTTSMKKVALGSRTELTCLAKGNPPPFITWSREDGPMPRDHEIRNEVLLIPSVRKEDYGKYVCRADNQYGMHQAYFELFQGDLIPYFVQNPSSYLSLQSLVDTQNDVNVEMSFKPMSSEGLILYNGQNDNSYRDFISLGHSSDSTDFRLMSDSQPLTISGPPLELNQWHAIQLKKYRNDASLVIDGREYRGRPSGDISNLRLTGNLFLGSVPDLDSVYQQTRQNSGANGCISRLTSNGRHIDIGAELLDSRDVLNCPVCSTNPCGNGGSCQPSSTPSGFSCECLPGFFGDFCNTKRSTCRPDMCGLQARCVYYESGSDYSCVCPLGLRGNNCEEGEKIQTAFFNRDSYLAYENPHLRHDTLDFSFLFKADSYTDAVLLYAAETAEGGDFVAFTFVDGYIHFLYDSGSGVVDIKSDKKIDLHRNTHITAQRSRFRGQLSIDNGFAAEHFADPGAYNEDQLTLDLNTPLYIGGVDNSKIRISPHLGSVSGFTGVITEVKVDDLYLDMINSVLSSNNIKQRDVKDEFASRICTFNCLNGGTCTVNEYKYGICNCPLGFSGEFCEDRDSVRTSVDFEKNGYVELPAKFLPHSSPLENEIIDFKILTTQRNGLILWQSGNPWLNRTSSTYQDYLSVGIINGKIDYSFDLGSGPLYLRSQTDIADGLQHHIRLERTGKKAFLEIDGHEMISGEAPGYHETLNTPGNIFLGGVPDVYVTTRNRFVNGLSGCLSLISFSEMGHINIEQDAISGVNAYKCSIDEFI